MRQLMRQITTSVFFALFAFTSPSYAQENPHYDVVHEYIRQLGAIHGLQETAARETATSKNQMADIIRNGTRLQLELRTSVNVFKGMKLSSPNETLLPTVIRFYEKKIELLDDLIEIASQFIVGSPKPGVDYAQLTAATPKITANIEHIDKALFGTSPLFFALLIDDKPDKKGHLSHLIITKAQRKQLVDSINSLFGARLNAKNQNYTVSTASLLKTYLLKDFKSSDDPW